MNWINLRRLVSVLDHSTLSDAEVLAELDQWRDRLDQSERRILHTYWYRDSTGRWLRELFNSAAFTDWRQKFNLSASIIGSRVEFFGPASWREVAPRAGSSNDLIGDDDEQLRQEARLRRMTPSDLLSRNLYLFLRNGTWGLIEKYLFHMELFWTVMSTYHDGDISEWSLVQFYWRFADRFQPTEMNVVGISYLPYLIREQLAPHLTGDFRGVNVRTSDEYRQALFQGNVLTHLIADPHLTGTRVLEQIEAAHAENPAGFDEHLIQGIGRWSIAHLLKRLMGGRLKFASFWYQVVVLHDNVELLQYLHQEAGRPAIPRATRVDVLSHYVNSPRCLKWLLDSNLLHFRPTEVSNEVEELLAAALKPPVVGSSHRVIDILDLYPLTVSILQKVDVGFRLGIIRRLDRASASPLIFRWLRQRA